MNISSNTAVFPSVNAEAPLFQSSQNVRGFWSCAVRTAGRGKHLSGAGNRECWTGWLEILPIRLRKPPQKWAYLGMPNISCISWTTEVSTVEICLKWGGVWWRGHILIFWTCHHGQVQVPLGAGPTQYGLDHLTHKTTPLLLPRYLSWIGCNGRLPTISSSSK